MFWFQGLSVRRFQHRFHWFDLHRLTMAAASRVCAASTACTAAAASASNAATL
jgi:hypothetical protein